MHTQLTLAIPTNDHLHSVSGTPSILSALGMAMSRPKTSQNEPVMSLTTNAIEIDIGHSNQWSSTLSLKYSIIHYRKWFTKVSEL